MTYENPGLMSYENPGLMTQENPGLITYENPGLRTYENSELMTYENPGLLTYENPGLKYLKKFSPIPYVRKIFEQRKRLNMRQGFIPSWPITHSNGQNTP